MLISIIVPVYNTEKYISECVDSILAQTFTDFELLLIDDGSTDNSGSICEEYAQRDLRVRVFHKENGGVASARNVGLDNSHGEWICFVDSDDTIQTDALSHLFQNIESDIDFVFSKYNVVDDEGKVLREYCAIDRICKLTLQDILKVLYELGECYQGYVWNKLFRMSVIRDNALRFNEKISFNEDRLFITQYVCNSKKSVKFLNLLTYSYLMHPNSAMSSLNNGYNRKFVTDFYALVLMKKEIEKLPFAKELRQYAVDGICRSYEWNHSMMLRFNDYDSYNHWRMLWGLIKTGAFMSHYMNVKRALVSLFFPIYIHYRKNKSEGV